MDYVLYVPGMPFNGETLARGLSLGGSESAGYYLARELARRGHRVTVFSALAPGETGVWEGVEYRALGRATPQAPWGDEFEAYVAGVPHDVLIGQRAPGLLHRPVAAKVTLWWTHDLALKRNLPALNQQLWNLSGLLCVSEFHKQQVGEVYGIKPERLTVVPNGVDPELFAAARKEGLGGAADKRRSKVLVYSSRPERGLAYLVGDGTPDRPGVMEHLLAADPSITLKVCGYDNTTPEMLPLYERLWRRCRELPNVDWLGALSKRELARLMTSAWLQVYPTRFEEVSCITAMEAQSAGTPVVTSPVAALPETLSNAGVLWLPLDEGGEPSPKHYADAVLGLRDDPEHWLRLHDNALAKATDYGWERAADAVEETVAACFARQCAQPARLARHLMRHSDIPALRDLLAAHEADGNPLLQRTQDELDACYRFAGEADFAPHYEAYYAYERERGVSYGPEVLDGSTRFETVSRHLEGLPDGAVVLDYGCAHGHYTINLARRFPHLRFIGIDLVQSNISTARAWAEQVGLQDAAGTLEEGTVGHSRDDSQVRFLCGTLEQHRDTLPELSAVIAAEVLEHVLHPAALADALAEKLRPDGRMILTTPYGPWEAQGYREHHPWRAHLHHLERADLEQLFALHPRFRVEAVAAGLSREGEALGSYVTTYRKPSQASGTLTGTLSESAVRARKQGRQAPRETLSVCMVVREDSDTLAACLNSVAAIADEIVLGIDRGTQAGAGAGRAGATAGGSAWAVAEAFGARAFAVPSPLSEGFDAARNATVEQAHGDWILWIDDDEQLLWPEQIPKYLRDNSYDAYAVKQHHFAAEPAGLIKTDLPCRLFRNRRGFKFYGLVHEHPELGLNKGPGQVLLLPDVAICHNGYVTEEVRRARFQRNLPLMFRDRERNGERLLGRFLWIRDLAHLNRFEFEQTGALSTAMRERAEEAVALWRGLLDEGQVRMAVDALPYYSEAANLLSGGGIECSLQLGIGYRGLGDSGEQPPPLCRGQFLDSGDIERLTSALVREKTALVSGPYV